MLTLSFTYKNVPIKREINVYNSNEITAFSAIYKNGGIKDLLIKKYDDVFQKKLLNFYLNRPLGKS